MNKIITFKSKEDLVKERVEKADIRNKDLIKAADAHVRKMEFKVNSGGGFSDRDIDEMIAHLGALANAGIREPRTEILKNTNMTDK